MRATCTTSPSPRRRRITGRSNRRADPSPARPPAAPRPSRRGHWLAAAGLAALVLLAYANSFGAGLVFDNKVLIAGDPRLEAITAEHLGQIFGRSYWWPYADTSLYRPLTTLSYLANYSLLGNQDRPFGYHAVNLLLHLANATMLFALGWRLLGRMRLAFFAAALWALHPLNTEAVTNIVGRADLLAASGVIAAIHALLRARDATGAARIIWLAVLAAASAVAVGSKESGVIVIGVVVMYDLLWRQGRPFARLAPQWFAVALPVAIWLVLRSTALGGISRGEFPFVDNPIRDLPFWLGRLTALDVATRYLRLAVWPAQLSADYSFQQIPLATGTPGDWLVLLLVPLGLAAGVALFRRQRSAFFLLASSAMAFLPVSNLLFATGTIMAERLVYLPLALLLPVVVLGLFEAGRAIRMPQVAPVLLAVAVAALGVRTFARNTVWTDELTLWTATADSAPRSFKSHGALAEAMYDADPTHANLDRVIAEKEISLSLLEASPVPAELSKPYREAATYYLERAEWLRSRGASDPEVTAAYTRAAALAERYLALLAERPERPADRNEGELLLATAYERLNRSDLAIDTARQVERRDPFNPAVYRASSSALTIAGRQDEAAVVLMTGFMLTGRTELRAGLIDLYRIGLDEQGCAVTEGAAGVTLNVACDIVRRHLCAAAVAAAAIQRDAGRADLAAQVEASTGTDCESTSGARR